MIRKAVRKWLGLEDVTDAVDAITKHLDIKIERQAPMIVKPKKKPAGFTKGAGN